MSNVLLAAIGMVVTMLAFGAFSIVQLGKAEASYGAPEHEVQAPAATDPLYEVPRE